MLLVKDLVSFHVQDPACLFSYALAYRRLAHIVSNSLYIYIYVVDSERCPYLDTLLTGIKYADCVMYTYVPTLNISICMVRMGLVNLYLLHFHEMIQAV